MYNTKFKILSIENQLVLFSILFDCIHSNSMFSKMRFLTVDLHLGRVDYASFSDQTLMEMLYEGFSAEAIKTCQNTEGVFLEVCDWHSVECDGDGNVVRFHDSHALSGSLQLCYIPPKVETFTLQFKHTTGSIDLTQLPRRMKDLYLLNNRLSGSVDLTQLPRSIRSLDIEGNRFSGEIDLTRLPVGMESLILKNNLFTGSLIAKNLPHYIQINARENNFSAIALVELQSKESNASILLRDSGVTSVIDENGDTNSEAMGFFRDEVELDWDCDDY